MEKKQNNRTCSTGLKLVSILTGLIVLRIVLCGRERAEILFVVIVVNQGNLFCNYRITQMFSNTGVDDHVEPLVTQVHRHQLYSPPNTLQILTPWTYCIYDCNRLNVFLLTDSLILAILIICLMIWDDKASGEVISLWGWSSWRWD